MAKITSRSGMVSTSKTQQKPAGGKFISRITQPLRAAGRAFVFFLKVFPMLPSRPIDWVTKTPVIEKVKYPSCTGLVEGDVYRPPDDGPHPGIVVCLGVVPFEVDHPQVPILGRALARAGFAALLYWSPAMRDFRLDPADIENISLAYHWFIHQPYVDPAKSGLLGTCVGGSFALMAAAQPLIRDQVGFVSAYAPFSSMWTFARDIASATRFTQAEREPWKVDPLTRKVFVHSLTSYLGSQEAGRLRDAFAEEQRGLSLDHLSADGQTIGSLFTPQNETQAEQRLHSLPAEIQSNLTVMSPIDYVDDIHSPLIILLHDQGDQVIPISESRQLYAALNHHEGVHFTEMRFSHLDPVKGKLPIPRLVRELGKFFGSVYPLFRQAVT